ncbi:MAG: 4-(cytidine 5'-diphospho)-2-C-methyl-D-erythritol kinase [Paracoccaceae bacterium]
MTAIEAFAPAKINLSLHITGRRDDGYHLLDSLVVFADIGDTLSVSLAPHRRLRVFGPMAAGVPDDGRNLILRAAGMMGQGVDVMLDKRLPAAAGIGGGSSDAAACLRAIGELTGKWPGDQGLRLGADVPVCMAARAARMRGIGEDVAVLSEIPEVFAVLVNPGVAVPTPEVFRRLKVKQNPPMGDIPDWADAGDLAVWLGRQRNDLQAPAVAAEPVIGTVLDAIGATGGCLLARMSGSGATCFGLYGDQAAADAAAAGLQRDGWWVAAARLS